jgi:chromosome segregation ATPase
LPTPEITRPVHHLARLSYLQSLFVHRRVLIVSDDRSLASFIKESRARYVCSISDRESSESWHTDGEDQDGEFKVVSYDDIKFRDGMFDVAVVLDLTAVSSHVNLLNELRRIVGPNGSVIAGAPNPICEQRIGPDPKTSSIDYYELYEILADAFPSVQMIGQAPFLGYAISDLSAGEESDGVSFDAGLLESGAEEIEWFLAVCGDSPVEIDPYSVVQVPINTIQMGGGLALELADAQREVKELGDERTTWKNENAVLRDDVQRIEASFKEAQLETGTRGVKIESLQKDLEHESQEAEAARARAVNVAKQFDDDRKVQQAKKIEEQIARQGAQNEIKEKVKKAQDEARQAQMRAESAEVARDRLVEQTRADLVELEQLRVQQEELERALSDHQEKERDLTEQLARSREQAQEAQEARAALSAIEDTAEKDRAMFEKEVAALEKQLALIGGDLRAAREDVTRHEALVRDLVVQIDEHASIEAEKETLDKENLDKNNALAERDGRIAELEADLQAAGWRADELEARGEDKDRVLEETKTILSVKDDELAAALGAISGQHRARVEAELALATVEARHAKTGKELDEFIAHSRELEAEFAAVAGACSGQHRARVEAELALATTEACHAKTEKELDEFIEGVRNAEESLGRERERFSDELTSLGSELAETHAKIHNLESYKSKVEELNSEITSGAKLRASMENDLANLDDKLAENNKQLAKAKEQIDDLNRRALEAEDALAATRSELDGAIKHADEKSQQLNEVEERIRREVSREIADARADARDGEHFQVELADARLELHSVRAELVSEVERTRQAGADAARLAGDNEDVKARLDERERKLNDCADEAAAGERALLAMRDDVAALGQQVAATREALRAEQVRSRSLLEDVDRLGKLEDGLIANAERSDRLEELEAAIEKERASFEEKTAGFDREREENAERIKQLETKVVSVEASAEAGQTQLKGYIAEANERTDKFELRIRDLLEEIEITKEKAAKSVLDEAAAAELVQIRLTSAKQAETIRRLTDESKERKPLLESLTSQLEERERRVTMMERKTRQIEDQIREHDSETTAWNTELRFRNTRITRLEKEISELKIQQAEGLSVGNGTEERISIPTLQAIRPSEIPSEIPSKIAAMKNQVSDLNEQLGDKDAELLILHSKLETENRDLKRTRQALNDLLAGGRIESATAVHINDILSALNRK